MTTPRPGSDHATVESLVAAMAQLHGAPYATAYGYLRAAVDQLLDGHLSRVELARSVNAVELALLTHHASLQKRRRQASER